LALAEDPECRRSEIIFILDSPEQRNEVEHLLRGLHRLTDLPATLVIMPRNLGYAAANNAGAREARGPVLLLLNSDVIPIGPGWLQMLTEPFSRPAVGAAGPRLLFEDGSIQHAGLHFERDEDGIWFNRHYHKGMPRHWPDAQKPRDVPGVTGAAMAMRRKLFEQIGGVCEDYIIGDYEDSDLCLRVRAAGSTITYVPEAELYHFERRSIWLHTGYTRTHAALYNRLLHHERWDQTITSLMAEPGPVRRRRA
jgi:GT2 family glycosyltransferase